MMKPAGIMEASTTEAIPHERRDRRRETILEVASAVFNEEGFAEASMSAIAARLGGSKGTLYNYFKNKEDLFAAYVREQCRRFGDGLFDVDADTGLAERLTVIGERLLGKLLSDWAVRTYQLVVAESRRTPELAQIFHEAGPAAGHRRLIGVLEAARAHGEIGPCDFNTAADQFMALCRGDLHLRFSLNLIERPSEDEIKAVVREAVLTFLARYGAT